MAFDKAKGTMLGNLIDPEVLGEYLSVKMMDAIKFAPLCGVNNELQGRPGSKLTLPVYNFIDIAQEVEEGDDVPVSQLAAESIEVGIYKIGKAVEITDEAILSAYGNPVDEIAKQLLMAIAGKVDKDCLEVFRKEQVTEEVEGETVVKERGVTLVHDNENKEFDKYVIADMMAKFGEDVEEEMTAIINPAHLAKLRRDVDFVQIMAGQAVISGEMGQLFGVRIVVSNQCPANEAFLVKTGAVKILMKRDVAVEADRDIRNKTNLFVADQHYGVYLEDQSKIVKAKNIK